MVQPALDHAGTLATDRERVEYFNDYIRTLLAYQKGKKGGGLRGLILPGLVALGEQDAVPAGEVVGGHVHMEPPPVHIHEVPGAPTPWWARRITAQ